MLRPLVSTMLDLETHEGLGFVAVALVDMEDLRPSRLPRIGTDAIFVGYRVFVRADLTDGRVRRGLKVIRTDVDRVHLLVGTRLLTRYDTGLVSATWRRDGGRQQIEVRSRWRGCGLAVETSLDEPATPPTGSPFRSWSEATPFSGPLPWTFAPTSRGRSVVGVKGVRSQWSPRPVTVRAHRVELFSRPPFAATEPVLAAAFHVADVAYSWRAGEDVAVRASAAETP